MTSLAYSNYGDCNKKEPAKSSKARTYKNKKPTTKKTMQFLNSMKTSEGFSATTDDEDDQMKYGLNGTQELTGEDYAPKEGNGLLQEGLEQQKEYHQKQGQYYNQYVPSYTGTQQNIPYYSQLLNTNNLQNSAPDELMKKLNYVVHLLEESHDEKTGSVTEELVLYMFLGVFVIFVVDSFSRSGKYKR